MDGLLESSPPIITRVLVEDVQEVVVAYLEHIGGDLHADRVALAQVVVDNYSHGGSPGLGYPNRCPDRKSAGTRT